VKVETHAMDAGPMDDNSPERERHGTCTASIACSGMGIMIKGTLVAIKTSRKNDVVTAADYCNSVAWAIEDIVKKERQGKSVINISQGKSIAYKVTFVHTNLYVCIASLPYSTASLADLDPEKYLTKQLAEELKVEWTKLLTAAEKEGIVVVAAAGNLVGIDRETPLHLYELTIRQGPAPINTYPALLGEKTSLIVVGSHDLYGKVSEFSQPGPGLVYALGEGGWCAFGTDAFAKYRGTSFGQSDRC
jgi:subtilase family protein